MKLHKIIAASVVALAAVGLGMGPASAATNLIVNGDFSSPSVGTGWGIYTNGGVSGWTSNNNETEIDNQLVVMPTYYLGVAGQSLELNGNQPDAISQTVTGLVVGQTYVLSWGYGDRTGGGGDYKAEVYFGGVKVATDTGTGTGEWTTNSVTLVATSTSEVLSFNGVEAGASASYGNEIADVSLTAVPEPATWAMFLIGFGTLGFMMRGSRRKDAAVTA